MFVTTKKNEVSLKLVLSCIEQLIEQGNILLGVISHFFKKKGVPFHYVKAKRIEYIRVEFKQSLGMNFVSPFQPEREFKVYNS